PNTFDRRGNVVWYDDFEGVGKKWADFYVLDAGTSVLSATRCYRGSQSMKMTTHNLAARSAGISKVLPNTTLH
ncbi:unnamed protein product, partial [marine sediment metagenome]